MEEKTVSLGGTQTAPKIPANKVTQVDEFVVPTDVVELPSLGKFYPNGQKTVTIKYLTAEDENILSNIELIRSQKVLDVLLDNCIVSEGISAQDMLSGDRVKVLIDMRINGYGADYEANVLDPETGEAFVEIVDLTKLKPKYLEVDPDSQGEYSVFLPKFKVNIKFRFLNGEDESYLAQKEKASKKKNKGMSFSTSLTDRYVRQIMEVNGNRDKIYIQRFVSAMPISDSLFLREYIKELEPGINLKYEFKNAPSGNVFEGDVEMTLKLFWPNAKI